MVTGQVRNILEFRCALDDTHRIPADQHAAHYIYVHGATDTAKSAPEVHVQDSRYRGTENDHWAYRETVVCPICHRHGVAVVFRTLRTSEETNQGDSLESHLRTFHGAT